jgi:2-amino-4-hydroxy-6-hydroxymethyldihydropteridine diphosphokinase
VTATPTLAFVGLGSNLDDPAAQLRRAREALSRLPQSELISTSKLFRSRPMGPRDQPDYTNAVAGVRTVLSARQLLAELQRIEADQGRRRASDRWGPRTLDLDLLTYGELVCREEGLELPHPGAHLRDFVLVPWCTIAPDAVIPGWGNVCELAKRCESHGLAPIDDVP